MANPFSAPVISGFNASPPPDDGSQITANQVKWSNHIIKIGTPLKNYIDDLVTNVNLAFATVDDASKLTTGIIPDARLSANVPLKNAANTFTASNPTIVMSAVVPMARWIATSAAANEQNWEMFANASGQLVISNSRNWRAKHSCCRPYIRQHRFVSLDCRFIHHQRRSRYYWRA